MLRLSASGQVVAAPAPQEGTRQGDPDVLGLQEVDEAMDAYIKSLLEKGIRFSRRLVEYL